MRVQYIYVCSIKPYLHYTRLHILHSDSTHTHTSDTGLRKSLAETVRDTVRRTVSVYVPRDLESMVNASGLVSRINAFCDDERTLGASTQPVHTQLTAQNTHTARSQHRAPRTRLLFIAIERRAPLRACLHKLTAKKPRAPRTCNCTVMELCAKRAKRTRLMAFLNSSMLLRWALFIEHHNVLTNLFLHIQKGKLYGSLLKNSTFN